MIVEVEKKTLRCLMERSFRLYANLPSLSHVGDLPITYQQLQEKIADLAVTLLSRNISPGDRIAILGENSPNWVISYMATVCIGAVAVPILPGFPETVTRHILRTSGAVVLFVSQKQRSKVEDLDKASLRSLFDLEDLQEEVLEKSGSNPVEKAQQKWKKRRGVSPTSWEILEEFPSPNPEDLASIIYTSGTSGQSKGVMLSHSNITNDVIFSIERFPIDHRDRFLSILPLSHTYEATGGLLSPLAVGSSLVYLKGLPTPQNLLTSMETARPTAVLMVPLILDKIFRRRILPQINSKPVIRSLYKLPYVRKKLHKLAGKKLIKSFGGRLRFFMFGGASLNKDVEIFLKDAEISYATGYGMTETSPIMTISPFGKIRFGSCGKPIPGIDLAIHNPNPRTGVGEIIVRGPTVMQGYYKNPEATQEIFLQDGWLKTGDLGCFDNEGYLYIKGRSKNVIVGPSGENIYPEMIEQLLLQNKYIQEAIVYEEADRLIAKAYLDYDELDKEFRRNKLNDAESEKLTHVLLEAARQEVNKELPGFSHIAKIVEHPEPFDKTPTNKIKRYLYVPNRN